MARPKRDEQERPAKERIEDAFFELLAQMPFEDITIRALASTAGVNHNLIYYYYENLQDLAAHALRNVASKELIATALIALLAGAFRPDFFLQNRDLMARFRKLILYARGDSAFLLRLLQDLLKDYWLQQMGRSEDSLSPEETVDLRFILAGLCSLLGDEKLLASPATILTIWERDLGIGIFETLAKISENGSE